MSLRKQQHSDGSVPEYSIILPTYNEAENLPICVWLIDKYMRDTKYNYEVVVLLDYFKLLIFDDCRKTWQ